MSLSHDRHNYFFEKYLRNEMSGEEKAAFEKRLLEDTVFKRDFEYYVLNRNEIVKGELAEYDEPELLRRRPQRWGWVYVAISLLCLVLIIDYFLSAHYTPEGRIIRKEPLIERINIFKSPSTEKSEPVVAEKEEVKTPEVLSAESDTTERPSKLDQELLPEILGEGVSIRGDYFVADSLFRVLDQALVNERLDAMMQGPDSLNADSIYLLPVLKGFFKTPANLPRQLLVEFWESPIHFKGYLFNGKKLILYEVGANDSVFLSCSENNTNYHLYLNGHEYHLFSDNQLHQLSEE